MIKNTDNKSFFKALAAIGFFFIATMLVFLGVEYRQLHKTAEDMLCLKEEYRSYVMALKRSLKEKTSEQSGEKNDVKKNSIDEKEVHNAPLFSSQKDFVDSEYPHETFVVVNREPRYLRAQALAYAKQYNLDQVLAKMFDTQEWHAKQKKKKGLLSKKNKKKKMHGISHRPEIFEEAVVVKTDRDFLFSWPIERSKFWLSSRFGPRKIGKRAWKFHYGIDMAAPRGTPVQAAASGIVVESCMHSGFGNCIVILHNHKYKTRYAHLHARYVKVGEEVNRGKVIGSVGTTGHVVSSKGNSAAHLHFEVYTFGRRVNPLSVLV